ncbi:MAG TPA: hypothetical protein ENG69_04675 [Candidatus Korarchaeota archaeon]|nr:hypothetical protein [Candidatus Korarchaeota archaeon]
MHRRPRRYSWRARARPRMEIPFSARFTLVEALYGAVIGALATGVALLISEFAVWVTILWMLREKTIIYTFYALMVSVSGMILSVPIFHRRRVRAVVAIAVAVLLWVLLVKRFDFHPIYTFFGELPY